MKEETPEKKVKSYSEQIRKEISQWKDINQNGCNDPFWTDGCNMNLTRNHIIYYQSKIREICTENRLPLPDEYYLAVPPEVNANYMANLKQKPRVERLRQTGRIMTGYVYQYDENQMSLFRAGRTAPVCLERRNKNESKLGKECFYNITDSDNRAKEVCH